MTVAGDEQYCIACNLENGFDTYDLRLRELLWTTKVESNGFPLPVLFIHEDQHVLFGSADGDVVIVCRKTDMVLQKLQHTSEYSQVS